jgi:ADP-ribose pyrophosphatase
VKSGNAVSESEGWETVSTETHFQNDHLSVATEEIGSPARPEPRRWTVVHRKRAVVIAPMTPDGKIILIRQERLPVHAAIWEVPAGQIDGAGEPDLNAITTVALRELREETGFELAQGGELIALGDYFTSPGFTDERGYFFLARPIRSAADGHAHEESESILDCRAFSPRELSRMINENEIRDANTLSICARLVARGLLSLDRD